MRFKVLGPLGVMKGDEPVALGGPKQRMVLAHLLVRVNDLVPADALIDQVWGESPPEAAKGTLHSYISHLRKALGAERIEGRPPGYVLHATEDELDAARFERLLHDARLANGSPSRAGTVLREALALWTGPAYADLASEPSLGAEIARLEELRLQALEERIAADLAEGRHGEVVGELEALTRELPLRERLWELLMLSLYRSRRPADALAAYERAREGLAQELGVDPSPDLRRLHERILREDPDLDLDGEPLRGYRLLEQVGEGAFGVVYRAIQPQVGREVAVKAVHPELANHPDFVRRFDHEAQVVARLEHPHVVPLYDYWREPDAAYLVMRFLRGGSVEDLLEAGPVDPSRVVTITEQVASALAAAHRQGIVHRDVKPGNVLLDEDGNAYLTDFGVALDAGSPERSTGTMMRGTPAYLSPEQIRLEPASPRSDVYALGIVVFEMLTGEHPFPESSLTALLDRHAHDPLPSVRTVRPELPSGVDEVIRRATAKDAEDRFPETTAMAAELRGALEGTRVLALETGPTRNPYKGLRAFLEADATDFFGREAVTKRLISALADDDPAARFLAVVGPSGSGEVVGGSRRARARSASRRAPWFGTLVRDRGPTRCPPVPRDRGRTDGRRRRASPFAHGRPRTRPGGPPAGRRSRAPRSRGRAPHRGGPAGGGLHDDRRRPRADAVPIEPAGGGTRSRQPGADRRDPSGRLLRCAAVGPGVRGPARRQDRGDHADVA